MDSRFDQFKTKMEKSLNSLKSELQTVRAGRANPKILDKVSVDYYGTKTPLNQLANFSIPEARVLLIQPYDKSAVKDIIKGINEADIGINPNLDGDVIRLVFPELNEERRKEIVKDIRKLAEDAKIAVRSIRRDAIDGFRKQQKDSEITEDELKVAEDEVQKITDKMVEEIDSILANKEKEVMSV